MSQIASPKRWLSVEEAAEYLGLAPRTLYNQTGPRAKRPFPVKPRRLGRSVRFDRLEIDAYLESQ